MFSPSTMRIGGDIKFIRNLPSGYVKIAIENGHLEWIFPLKLVIFHSYVSLPESTIARSSYVGLVHGQKISIPWK